MLPGGDPVHKVSILPRGQALGYNLTLPIEDRHLITKPEILNRIKMLLAGRAGEDLVFGESSTGAHDDLEKATRTVRRMVTEFGMSELGPLTFGNRRDSPFLGRDFARERDYSEEVAAAIDREVRSLIQSNYSEVRELLSTNREALDRVAEALLERETLDGAEFEQVMVKAGLELPPLAAVEPAAAEPAEGAQSEPVGEPKVGGTGKRLSPKEALAR